MPNNTLPDWERVLSAAAHLQEFISDAVLVGGTAAALYTGHRISTDADHVITDLRQRFDNLYPQPNGESALQQLMIQIANPIPFDLEEMNLSEYKHLETYWQNWENVKHVLSRVSVLIFDQIIGFEDK
jgi:hypothetical protein